MSTTPSSKEMIPKNWSYIGEIIKASKNEENEILLTYVLTWNILGKSPTKEEMDKILPKDKKYDLYIVNTQECLKSIGASFIGSAKDKWVEMLKKHFGNDYVNVANESLSAFQISIFAHSSISKDITNIKTGTIKTGFLNIMANKGATAISFNYKTKSFLFLNSHLTSGQEKSMDRNKDFERINNELNLELVETQNITNNNTNNNSNNKDSTNDKKENEFTTISDKYDIAIWSGDFNYRINLSKNAVFEGIKNNDYEQLREYDQLNVEVGFGRLNFNNFDEGVIYFKPSYKYKVNEQKEGNDIYDDSRIPGWCDRIIYKTKRLSDLLLCKYDTVSGTKTSDHKPVYAVFKIEIGREDQKSLTSLNLKKNEKTAACLIY